MEEKALIDALQYDFPLAPEPYAVLAGRLDEDPVAVMRHVRDLLDRGTLRAIRGFFDSKRLNYLSALIAAHVPDASLENVAAHVSAHPGVSHNYAREHHYNLWFTLTIPNSMDMKLTAASLLPGVDDFLVLPAIRLFKIDARFAMRRRHSSVDAEQELAGADGEAFEPFEPDSVDRRAVYALNQELPVDEQPFRRLAEQANLTEEVLLERAKYYLNQGIMRRYGAIVNHRRAGFSANGMTGWVAPPERVESVGRLFAQVPAVSHCYERPTYPTWLYNLFTMIHGRTREDVEAVIQGMVRDSGLTEYAVLYSTVEFKKAAVAYFDPALDASGNNQV